MIKKPERVLSAVTSHQLIRFEEGNYRRVYLGSRYIVTLLENGVGFTHLGDDRVLLFLGAGSELFDVFRHLQDGMIYEELLAALPPTIEDKSAFVAELWQKGIVL